MSHGLHSLPKPVRKVADVVLPIAASYFGGPVGGAAYGAVHSLTDGNGGLNNGGLGRAALNGIKGGVEGYLGNMASGSNSLFGTAGDYFEGTGSLGGNVGSFLSNIGQPSVSSGASKLASAGNVFNASAPAKTGLASIISGNSGGSLSSFINPATSIFSGIQSTDAADEAKKKLLLAQGKAASLLNPYVTTGKQANSALATNLANGFDASSLPNDPGYQFQLAQGQQALDRSLGARGNVFSGSALKAAADYSKGLTDTTLQDAFNRYQAQNSALQTASNSGQTAANSLGDIYSGIGNTNATADVTKSNILNSTLSNVLSGQGGVYNTGSGGLNIQQLLALLGKNGTTGATA